MARSYTGRSLPEDDSQAPAAAHLAAANVETISAGQGARVTTRKNASAAAERAREGAQRRHAANRLSGKNRPSYGSKRKEDISINKTQVTVLAVAALVVVGLLIFLISRALGSASSAISGPSAGEGQQEATVGSTISTHGASVTLARQGDGSYAVLATGPDAANPITLFRVPGEPVSLLVRGDVFLVPENLGGSWDVVSFTWGADAPATQLAGEDGSPITGTGSISEAVLDGNMLRIVDSAGGSTEILLD